MGFRENVQSALQQAACSLIADPDEDWLGGLVRRIPGIGEPLSDTRERSSRAIRGALGCSGGFGEPGSGGGSGRSGQCATQYRVRAFFTYVPLGSPPDTPTTTELFGENDTNTYTGPLGQPELEDNGQRVSIKWSNSSARVNGPFYQGDQPGWSPVVVRVDGEPDNCGQDGQPIGPPGPRPLPIDGVDGSPEVTFGPPTIGPDGGITGPFCINISGIQLCGNLDLLGGPITIGYGPGRGDSGKCCDRIPGPEEELPEDEEPPPEDEPPVPIVAAVVDARSDGQNLRATEILQEGNPNVFGPRIGHIAFRVKVGDGYRWTNPLDVKGLSVVIQCPYEGGAVDVKGTPDDGFIWTITPILATIPEENQ